MSQALPPPSEVLNPNDTPVTSQPTPSSHSNGSFAPVFAVLAVILVVSAVACVFGRFCNKRRKEAAHYHHKASSKQQSHHQGLGPREWESKQKPIYDMNGYGDIELGFGKGKFSGHKQDNKNGGKRKSSHT